MGPHLTRLREHHRFDPMPRAQRGGVGLRGQVLHRSATLDHGLICFDRFDVFQHADVPPGGQELTCVSVIPKSPRMSQIGTSVPMNEAM